jgi:hypothetical protein
MDSRGSSADVTSSAWSERFADEDGVVEVCSALEALWEYGSSSEEEGLSMVISIGPESAEAGQDIRSTTPASDCRPAQAGERRGSADLLPLKFKGYPKEVIEGELSSMILAHDQNHSHLPLVFAFEHILQAPGVSCTRQLSRLK